jgi:serine/threonine protein kinase
MLRPDMELGNYRLLERLGAGGMGEVWRAEDTRLLRKVAIKILPPQLANDEEWKERFLREARTIAQLNHPNIATIYSIAEDGEFFFIAMELVEGEPLSNLIARGPVPPADAVRIAAAVADGLAEAHEKGIIHRDIKPDNILVSKKVVKVLDFGIAKQIGGTADPGLTMGGMVMGTPHYMSPEQALGRDFDPRTDIFSLGRRALRDAHGPPAVHGRRGHAGPAADRHDRAARHRHGGSRHHAATGGSRETLHGQAGRGSLPHLGRNAEGPGGHAAR